MRRFLSVSIAACALSACANAVPIIFTLQGTATGTANGVPFTAASFTITYSSDTSVLPNSDTLLFYPRKIISFTIAGVGSGTFSKGFYLFTFVGTSLINLFEPVSDTGYFGIIYPNLAKHPFDAAFGPVSIVLAPSSGLQNSPSSLGNITFSSVSNLTFGAVTPTIPLPPTPLPSSLILALTGLAGAVIWYRVRRKPASEIQSSTIGAA